MLGYQLPPPPSPILCWPPPASLPMEPAKDTEGQVQAKAPGGWKLDLIVVQRAIREHVLLDGCLHRALWREGGRFTGTLWLSASHVAQPFGKAAEEAASIRTLSVGTILSST